VPARPDTGRPSKIGRRPGSVHLLAITLLVAGAALVFTARGGSARAGIDVQRGATLFETTFSPSQGLGPLFNNTSCLACHNTPAIGGGGSNGLATVLRVGRINDAVFDALLGRGGPVARGHSIAELGSTCQLSAGVPTNANITSVRNAPPLFGAGLIDMIPDAEILALAVPRADGIRGKANQVGDRVGRFGWKADTPSLRQFVGEAFRNELGLTNPVAPTDLVEGCANGGVKLDASVVDSVTAFGGSLPAPARRPGDPTLFERLGCGSCHAASLAGAPLYSDLLLHDMGRALDDGVTQGQAAGRDWRTTPLWGLRDRTRFLHDGRARTVEAAILAHSGEAEPVVQRFRGLSATDQAALLAFLGTL
jgi:CxxC motif-containing protein (DUF1111 family)